MTSSTVGKDGRAALVTKQSSDVTEGSGTKFGVWRDISTAPKDGSEILLLAHGMAIQARYCPGEWSEDTPISPREYEGAIWCAFDDAVQFEIEETDEGDHHGPVTGWMPLPDGTLGDAA